MTAGPLDRLQALAERATGRRQGISCGLEWPEWTRAAPAAVMRSALFGLVQRGRRGRVCGQVATWAGGVIEYEGDALDQSDMDVWLQALHQCRSSEGFLAAALRPEQFLHALGRQAGGSDRTWLFGCLDRMQRGTVVVELKDGRRYQGSLINEFLRDAAGGYVLGISPVLARLFGRDYVQVPWDTRLQLRTALAKWLHSYVCSHRATPDDPHRVTLEQLYALTGSSRSVAKEWARDVRAAARELEAIGELESWQVSRGVLTFIRDSATPDPG